MNINTLKFRIICCFVLCLMEPSIYSESPDLEIKIASIPKDFPSVFMLPIGERFVSIISENSSVHLSKFVPIDFIVIITNLSDSKYYFYEEENCLGYISLEFEAKLEDSEEIITIEKKPYEFYRNAPIVRPLSKGQSFAIFISFNTKIWENIDKIEGKEDKCKIRAKFRQQKIKDKDNYPYVSKEASFLEVYSDWYSLSDLLAFFLERKLPNFEKREK